MGDLIEAFKLLNCKLQPEIKIFEVDNLSAIEVCLELVGKNFNYSLKNVLTSLDDENVVKGCKVVELALQRAKDDSIFVECLDIIDNLPDIIALNVLNVLLLDSRKELLLTKLDLLQNYLLNENIEKKVRNYLIAVIIPKYLDIGGQVVEELIWNNFKFDVVCPVVNTFLSERILCRDEFWLKLQVGLAEQNKSANYIFKAAVSKIQGLNQVLNCELIKNSDHQALQCLIILLEVVPEKQLHLIQPSLGLLEKVMCLHDTWVKLIFGLFLSHPQSAIVYYTVIISLKYNPDLMISDILNALNRSDYSFLAKKTFKTFGLYARSLDKEAFESILTASLTVNWVPIGFSSLYREFLHEDTRISAKLLHGILLKAKKVPHKYIRRGIIHQVYEKLIKTLSSFTIIDLKDILIEFLINEEWKCYASLILSSNNIAVSKDDLNVMSKWLKVAVPDLRKIYLIVEVVNRANVERSWIEANIVGPFLERKYCTQVLDRLTYVYCIKTYQLENYLLARLDCIEAADKVCHVDTSRALCIKASQILSSASNKNQTLAFEVLFYLSENRLKMVYLYWISKILADPQIESSLALGLVNLLMKIPSHYLANAVPFGDVLKVYEVFFTTQPLEVVVKIFRNLDIVFQHIKPTNKNFIELCLRQLSEMKSSEYFRDAVWHFVRNIAMHTNKLDEAITDVALSGLYEIGQNSETVVYLSMMYFKGQKINIKMFPKHEFLLHGDMLTKDKMAEYEICSKLFVCNPYFRTAEIRKFALEDILVDPKQEKINFVAEYLLKQYKLNFGKRYFPHSLLHLHKLRIMQAFSFLVPFVSAAMKNTLVELLVESFKEESHQTSVKHIMQYLLIQLLGDRTNLLIDTIEDSNKNTPNTISGFIPILYGLELQKGDVDFSMSCVEAILPWTMGANFKLRLYSQHVIKKICDRNVNNRKFKIKYDSLSKSIDSVLSSTTHMDNSLAKDLQLVELIANLRPHSNRSKLIELITIFIPQNDGVVHSEFEYFKMKFCYCEYIEDTKKLEESDLDLVEKFENIQKKIIPWREFESGGEKTDLIVVASLVDSLPNLGGLSRTCEIFGVKRLVLGNHKVASERDFQNLSMSSEKWLEIIEVKTVDMQEFILKMKAQGYTVIGAEQTADSSSLANYKFDKKTVLVLGNERSGIPPNLIPLLDVCVEIPQRGVVRSLNVHVAGATFIWEYTRQQMMTQFHS